MGSAASTPHHNNGNSYDYPSIDTSKTPNSATKHVTTPKYNSDFDFQVEDVIIGEEEGNDQNDNSAGKNRHHKAAEEEKPPTTINVTKAENTSNSSPKKGTHKRKKRARSTPNASSPVPATQHTPSSIGSSGNSGANRHDYNTTTRVSNFGPTNSNGSGMTAASSPLPITSPTSTNSSDLSKISTANAAAVKAKSRKYSAEDDVVPHLNSPLTPINVSNAQDILSPTNSQKPLIPSLPEDHYDVPRNFCQSKVVDLLLILVSASGIRAADYNGKSDPYAKICVKGSKFCPTRKTRTVMRTLNPRWNEEHWFHIRTAPGDEKTAPDRFLEIVLFDYDRMTKDDFLASIELDLMDYMHQDQSVVELALPFQKGKGRVRCILAWRLLANPSVPVFPSNGVNEYYTQESLSSINEAWNHCVKAEKKDSRWKLHEYCDYIWIVRLEGFQGEYNPMRGAILFCKLTFHPSFPETLPAVHFLTEFLHPNIDDNRELIHGFKKLKDSSPKELPFFLDVLARLMERPAINNAVNKQLVTLYNQKLPYQPEGSRYYERIRGDIEKNAL